MKYVQLKIRATCTKIIILKPKIVKMLMMTYVFLVLHREHSLCLLFILLTS